MEFIKCELCGLHFERISGAHLYYTHGISSRQYEEMFPGATTETDEVYRRKVASGPIGNSEWWTLRRRNQLSQTVREFWTSEEREKLGEKLREAHSKMSPETRSHRNKAISEALTGRYPTEEARRHLREGMARYLADETPEHKEARYEVLSQNLTGVPKSEAAKEHMRQAQEVYWASLTLEEKRKKLKPMIEAARGIQSPSGPERMLWKFLDQAFPGMFIPDWVERLDVGGRYPDFRTKNGYKLVIESNGGYWHEDWGEEEQVAHYGKYGWDCLVVWAGSAEDIIYEWPNLAKRIRQDIEKTERR